MLYFLMPEVFNCQEEFDKTFNIESDSMEDKEKVIRQLHQLLGPFMLRRLKSDVERSLPVVERMVFYVAQSRDDFVREDDPHAARVIQEGVGE